MAVIHHPLGVLLGFAGKTADLGGGQAALFGDARDLVAQVALDPEFVRVGDALVRQEVAAAADREILVLLFVAREKEDPAGAGGVSVFDGVRRKSERF